MRDEYSDNLIGFERLLALFKDGIVIPALNDPSNKDMVVVVGDETLPPLGIVNVAKWDGGISIYSYLSITVCRGINSPQVGSDRLFSKLILR